MKNLFSSPRATRLLAVVIAWCLGTLLFAIFWMWPHGGPEDPGLVAKLIVLFLFGSIFLWEAYDYWKAWLIEYRYGLRLALTDRGIEAINGTTTINELQFLPSTVVPSGLIDQPVTKEKLRFPWPSLICNTLLFTFYFFQFANLNQMPFFWIISFPILGLYFHRPFSRWANYLVETSTFESIEAEEKSLLPLDKNLTRTDDSNFYRFHERELIELGFHSQGEQRHRHFFTSPAGDVIAILGREKHCVKIPKDYLSLISIDDQGCIHESCSLDRPHLKKWADCHELWRFQTLDTCDVVSALMRHQEFATSESSGQQFVVANQYPSFAKYFHEVTANAKIRYYNEYRIAFA